MIDIFITTKNRPDLFRDSLSSLFACTPRELFRLTVVQDGGYVATTAVVEDFACKINHVIRHHDNEGLGPSINQALAHIDAVNRWYETSPDVDDEHLISDFVCYCQDDLLYSSGWLEKLTKMFLLFEKQKNLGFASGVECVEHATREKINDTVILKDWIRAAQMFARREYWMSMWPIHPLDPETGRKRAKPNDGMGSGVDWWFIRNHENSVCRSGKTCLVMPGLVRHMGYNDSTWLAREMPESEDDKRAISVHAEAKKAFFGEVDW